MKKIIVIAGVIIAILLGVTLLRPGKNETMAEQKEIEAAETEREVTVRIIDETRGGTLFSERKPTTPEDFRAIKFMQSDVGEWTRNYCYEKKLDPFVVFSLMEYESDFNPESVGDGGESVGILQIQKKWHYEEMERVGVSDLTDPRESVKAAVEIILDYADIEGEQKDLCYVLMAYNGGEAYARKYSETSPSDYAIEIMDQAVVLRELYEGARYEGTD